MPKDRNGVELTPGDIITYEGSVDVERYIFLKEMDNIVHYLCFGPKMGGWVCAKVADAFFTGERIEVVGKMPDLWHILEKIR